MTRSLRWVALFGLLGFVPACGSSATVGSAFTQPSTTTTTASGLISVEDVTDQAIALFGSDADAGAAVLTAAGRGYDLLQIIEGIDDGTLQADGSITGVTPSGESGGLIELGSGDPDSPASTSSTTSSASSTTSSTTVQLDSGVILDETFDGPTPFTPLFKEAVMSSTVTADGVLDLRVFTTGVIPAMYPEPVPSRVEISFDFNPQPNNSTASYGAVVMSEDPSDGILGHYLAIWANPSDGLLTAIPWNDGWGEAVVQAIPPDVGYAADDWFRMRIVLADGAVDIYLDDVFVASWNGPTPVTSGYWGPAIIGAAPGDGLLVDNVLVEETP